MKLLLFLTLVFVIQINYSSCLRHVGDHSGNGYHERARDREHSHEQWRGGSHGYLGESGRADLSGHWPGPGRWPEGAGHWPEGAGHWPEGAGHWPEGAGRWPEGAGRWPEGVAGRWPIGGRWPGGEPGRWPGGWPGHWIGGVPLQDNDGGYYKIIDKEYDQDDKEYEEACRLACLPGTYHDVRIVGGRQDHFGRSHFKYSCHCYPF